MKWKYWQITAKLTDKKELNYLQEYVMFKLFIGSGSCKYDRVYKRYPHIIIRADGYAIHNKLLTAIGLQTSVVKIETIKLTEEEYKQGWSRGY